ncbi:hypothetical protein FJ365_05860 [Candidatus Dependentiae bacterium]|nr:hypothetical protein [Candidatus Dependentiae bacterium]
MLYRLVRTFILCACLLVTAAHATVESSEALEQHNTQTLSAHTEALVTEIAMLDAELDSFSALDDFELPPVDTSFWMQVKMARDLLIAHINQNKIAYLAGAAATVAAITALCIYTKKQAAKPA